MFRSRFTKKDAIVLAAVLLFAALLFLLPALLSRTGSRLVIRTPEGEQSYSLEEDRLLSVASGGYTLTVEILDGRARVRDVDCPDGVCRRTGWIAKAGETVVCAPAGVRLLIVETEGGDGDVDFVVG